MAVRSVVGDAVWASITPAKSPGMWGSLAAIQALSNLPGDAQGPQIIQRTNGVRNILDCLNLGYNVIRNANFIYGAFENMVKL